MKKILFLSFNYPYGDIDPSTNCSVRIMRELSKKKNYEVHCFCCMFEGNNKYEIIPNVILHNLQLSSKTYINKKRSKFTTNLVQSLKIPIYPLYSLFKDYRHYIACKKLLQKEKFDLVISQCFPERSWFTSVLLKKNDHCDRLAIIFWDNIYGLIPRRVIPKSFALRRQRKVENWVAKYADLLISLYPIKQFHQEYGEVPNAIGKREYLGIPAIICPNKKEDTPYKKFIMEDKINILYSGTLFDIQHINYLIDLFNVTNIAKRINIILLTKGISNEKEKKLKNKFNGSIQFSGWIPLTDLMNLYHYVDFFLSFPGIPTAIRSKVYEYMSYGKPLILFYENDNDVNIQTFSQYPLCLSIDIRESIFDNTELIEQHIIQNNGNIVPFEETARIYRTDSPSAYVDIIDKILR